MIYSLKNFTLYGGYAIIIIHVNGIAVDVISQEKESIHTLAETTVRHKRQSS
jgi:hypothetical protein